jgi:starch-binding outer membrane protein, SusD/RagB family
MKNSTKYLVLLIAVLFTVSCSKEFIDNPPDDKLVLDNFYTSDGQVLGSGSGLYGRPWFYFNEKFIYGLGETYSGNSVGAYQDLAQFENFSVNSSNQFIFEGWQSLFNVIAQSNTLLYNLNKNVGPETTPEVVERVKGEAYFMRATAYLYLVRTFGAVPILNRIEQYTQKIPTYRNNVDDVYKFIISDYNEAYKRLPATVITAGRVTRSACDGMLSKVYITLKDYPNAKLYSEKVINSGDYSLIDDYGLLFNSPANNNSRESIFALQWIGCVGYGYGNSAQAYITPTSEITGDYSGWKTFLPSIDLRNAYEVGDKRRKATVMIPGDSYPELVTKKPGGLVVSPSGFGGSLGFRKYVIGSNVEFAGTCPQQTGQNTSILRYAEILLINAESILAGGASTSSAAALTPFNQVRARAGLPAKTTITQDDIFKERRVELALEGDYWYDLVRRDRTEAINIIKNQERGEYSNIALLQVASKKVTPSANSFIIPIPGSELDANPLLREDPVPFQF